MLKALLLISFNFLALYLVYLVFSQDLQSEVNIFNTITNLSENSTNNTEKNIRQEFLSNYNLKTNTSKASIDLNKVLSGARKDSIPAITDPNFISIQSSIERPSSLGILVNIDGVEKYYPYSILLWHEIVNDKINDKNFAVTFCPLCASAIVFDRNVNGETLTFGVSGLLYESNLLMYDFLTESLWSQSLGRAVIGEKVDSELSLLPFQLITFQELKEKYPDALVLSRKTGHTRNYGFYPYGNYENEEEVYFLVSHTDDRFFSKELFYIVPYKEEYIALQVEKIKEGSSEYIAGEHLINVNKDGGELEIFVNEEQKYGYYEFWFSFITNHKDDSLIAKSAN